MGKSWGWDSRRAKQSTLKSRGHGLAPGSIGRTRIDKYLLYIPIYPPPPSIISGLDNNSVAMSGHKKDKQKV